MKITNLNVKKIIMMEMLSMSLVLTNAESKFIPNNISTVEAYSKEKTGQEKEDETIIWLKKKLVANGDLSNTALNRKCEHRCHDIYFKKIKLLFAYIDNEILENESCEIYSYKNEKASKLINPSSYGKLPFRTIYSGEDYITLTNDDGKVFKIDTYNPTDSISLFKNQLKYIVTTKYDDTYGELSYDPYHGKLEVWVYKLDENGQEEWLINDKSYTVSSDDNIAMMEQLSIIYNQSIIEPLDIYNNIDKIVTASYNPTKSNNQNANITQTTINNNANITQTTINNNDTKSDTTTNTTNPYDGFVSIINKNNNQIKNIDNEKINDLVDEFAPKSTNLKAVLPKFINLYLQSNEDKDEGIKNIKENKYIQFYLNDNNILSVDSYDDYSSISLTYVSDNTFNKSITYYDHNCKEKESYNLEVYSSCYSIIYTPYSESDNNLTIVSYSAVEYGGEVWTWNYTIPAEMSDDMINELFKYYENKITYQELNDKINDISNSNKLLKEKTYLKK